MKKDIIQKQVTQVAIVIAPRDNKPQGDLWDAYLVNHSNETLLNVLISSRGHGVIDGRDKTTTILRYFFASVEPRSVVSIEPIQKILFDLNNEYWVSFNLGEEMLDKKFVFSANSISAAALNHVDLLEKSGILVD